MPPMTGWRRRRCRPISPPLSKRPVSARCSRASIRGTATRSCTVFRPRSAPRRGLAESRPSSKCSRRAKSRTERRDNDDRSALTGQPPAKPWEVLGTSTNDSSGRQPAFSGRTAWGRSLQTPLREFLRTETGGAAVLLAATVAALVWVNIDASSYGSLWSTTLSVDLGGEGIAMDLRHWVNSGLMTLFFFVV